MINGQPMLPDAVERLARVYRAGSCTMCRHEPLARGFRKVVWTEADRLCTEIEPCPFIACPQAKEELPS